MNVYELLTTGSRLEPRSDKVYGGVVGVVTNNRDPEQLHRVKVRFPWLSEDEESHWARVLSFMAGAGRGGYFLPEVDDEVLVVFAHGDVRHPYVLGALWNGVDAPPRDNSAGTNDLRVVTSRSGHEIVLDDTSGAEQVAVTTAAGHAITLDDTAGGEKISIVDKAGNSIEIDAVGGEIAISSQTKLSLRSQVVEIGAGATLKIEAGATLEVKGALVKIN